MVKQEKPTVAPRSRPAPKAKPEPLKTPVDVNYLLMSSGEDFQIHKVGCKHYKAAKARSQYAGIDDITLEGVINQREVIMEVWDDIIRDYFLEQNPVADGEEEPDYATVSWGWLDKNGFVDSVKFHTCLDGLPQQAKTAAKGASTKKSAKLELATLVAEAAGQMLADLLGASLADPEEPYAASASLVKSGFRDDDEIRQCVAQWLHGLPCDRERWVASGMAIPDRSDWVAFRAAMAKRELAASDGQNPADASATAPAEDSEEDTADAE